MSNLPKIHIKTEGTITRVFIDDRQIEGVKRLSIDQEAGQIMKINLNLLTDKLTIDGEALPEIPEAYKPFYKYDPNYERKEPSDDDSSFD